MGSLVRVVKIGGSLLDLPDLDARLKSWLDIQTPAHHVLITGGGSLVEEVRRWNAQWPLDEKMAHWVCVDLMSATIRLFQSRFPRIPLTKEEGCLTDRLKSPGATFFDVSKWLRESEPDLPGRALPANWEVTSDSIAARLATCLGASELVLLKSCTPDRFGENILPELTASGLVDQGLGQFVAGIPQLRVVNLRLNPPEETRFRTLEPHARHL